MVMIDNSKSDGCFSICNKDYDDYVGDNSGTEVCYGRDIWF